MTKTKAKLQSPLTIGASVLIRSVTNYYTGQIVALERDMIVLRDAAWIAETGRFADALRTGTLGEVEPYPDGLVCVGRGAVIDVCVWAHPLPRVQR